MSAVSSRALALLTLAPSLVVLASCELYLRSDEVADDDVHDGGGLPDAAVPPDAAIPPDANAVDAPPVVPPNPGFVTPGATTRANAFRNGQWTDVGPADWSCLAQPPAETVPAGGYTLTGTVRELASNQSVGGAAIVASAAGQTLASATSSSQQGARGQYRLDIPALPNGATRLRFAVSTMASRDTITIDRYLGPVGLTTLDLPIMSEQTAQALPSFVGEAPEASAGFVIGEVRDCQGRQVSGAIVALSTSPTFVAHWPGGVTFYFSAAAQSLPVRHQTRTETNRDGRFMIIGPTPSGVDIEGTVQAFGFQTDADRSAGTLALLGKSAAVVQARTVSVVVLGRTRAFIGAN
jgi:hypothetical protein